MRQSDAVMINRHRKIKDPAKISAHSKMKNNSVNRNTANMLTNSAHGQYGINKRYDSSIKTTNVGSSAA